MSGYCSEARSRTIEHVTAQQMRAVTTTRLSSLACLASIEFDVRKVGWLRCMDLGVDPESGNLAPISSVDASNWRACSEYSVNNVSFAIVLT
jgi:hypothetical protein